MAKLEIEAFLTYLAVDKRKVSPTTQNQAFSAILFLYKEVLGIDMSSWNIQALRAQERKHIPQVLTKDEVKKVIDNLTGIYQLIVLSYVWLWTSYERSIKSQDKRYRLWV